MSSSAISEMFTHLSGDLMVSESQDRSIPFNQTERALKMWDFDLYTRHPGSAYLEDGVIGPANIDLSTFMYALARRGAVLNLPQYKSMRAATKRKGEHVMSKENRHGKINGLYANKDVFSFGVRIIDQNVMKQDDESNEMGAPRNFALMDVEGRWHEGWKTIDFYPSAKENDFLNDTEQWDDSKITFDKFVMPQRWISIFSKSYVITKLLIDRLAEESKHYFSEIKRLREAGVSEEGSSAYSKTETVGETKSILCDTFEAVIEYPERTGEYPEVEETSKELTRIKKLRSYYNYTVIPQLRFATRCVEYAFWKHGDQGDPKTGNDLRKPSRIIADWEYGMKLPRARKTWSRLVLAPETESSPEVALRVRIGSKTEKVAADG